MTRARGVPAAMGAAGSPGAGRGERCRSARPAAIAGRLLAGLVLTLLAQGPAAAGNAVVDATGRPVALEALPSRIISLVPSATEILWSLGAQDTLVGVTDFCDYPPAARSKPRVGGMVAPSLEAIVALRPELVIATSAGNSQETFDQLRRLRIPVYRVAPDSLADVLTLVRRLGELTGRADEGRALAARLEGRIREVAERVASRPRPRVLYVLWPDPLMVPGRGALVTELIGLAGGRSVTADVPEAYPRYSAEAAVARSPEIVFLARHGAAPGSAAAREKWQRFGNLPAIRAGRLHEVDGSLLHRYGPRVVEGLEMLARLTHPEAFGMSPDPAAGRGPRAPR